MEEQNPEVAQALHEHFAHTLARSNPERHKVQDALAEANEPLFPTVDDGLVGYKAFECFRHRKGYPSVAAALALVRDWVLGAGCPMLTLGGPPGTGKTHLAQAAAFYLKDQGRTVLHRTEADLIGELMSRMSTKTTEALLQAVCQTPWLVLDDMGVATKTDWNESVFDRLINARYELAQAGLGSTMHHYQHRIQRPQR